MAPGCICWLAKHPSLGICSGAEAMFLIAAHSRRHAAQIREIRSALYVNE